MAQEVDTVKQPSKAVALVNMIENRKQEISTLLHSGDVDAFLRILKNALIKDPKIAEADQSSVFLEVQKAAQDGLVLDGREAALVRYKSRRKVGNQWEDYVAVSYIPMIQGIQKRVKNTGNIQSWSAALVYANEAKAERFKFWRDDLGLHLVHQPFLPVIDGERGEFVAAYSAVRYRDGTVDYEIMAVDELDRIMDRTKSKDREGNITGPWRDDRAEMQKKTVMRRHAKRLDVSSELRTIIERVDEQYDFKQSPDEVYQMDEAGAPRAVANRRRASAAELLKAAQARQEPEPEGPQHAEHFEGDDDEAPPPAKGKAAPKAKATQQPEPQQQQPEQTGDQVNPADDF